MGLERKAADQLSLLDVSAKRFPYYLAFVEVVVLTGVATVLVEGLQLDKPLVQRIVPVLDALAEYLNNYVSAAILACGAVEGVIMGLGEIRTQQKVAAACREASEEARRKERERLFRSGAPVQCPIWGTPATLFPTARAAAVFNIDSDRAGGKYEISLQLLAQIVNGSLTFTDQDKIAVTEWLAAQRAAGEDPPVLTDEVIRNTIR